MEFSDINQTPLIESGLLKTIGLYVSEQEFNLCIQSATDITLLRTALELKHTLILRKEHSTINFPIMNILKQIYPSNIDETCKVLQLALLVQSDQTQYAVLLDYIKTHLRKAGDECYVINMLKLLGIALALSNFENNMKAFELFAETDNFHDSICSLLSKDSKIILNFLSIYTLPVYLKCGMPGAKYILEAIWNNTLESKNLHLLCSISDFFFPTNTDFDDSYPLINFDAFWLLLQDCLNSNSSIVQKQALFLLKHAIQSIKIKENFMTPSKLVFWSTDCKEEIYSAWHNLFMLFEIVREKQLHLIEPSYQLLSTIKILHPSWLLCIYKMLLTHSHSSVALYAILDVLKSDWYEDIKIYETVINCLLSALNRIECVNKDDIWSTLNMFASTISNEKFTILLYRSATILWIPSVCYRFYKSVFTRDCQIFITSDLIEQIFANMEKLPHKFIRTGCMDLVKNFIDRVFLSSELNFNDFMIINKALRRNKYSSCTKLDIVNYKLYVPDIKQIIVTWTHPTANIDLNDVKIILELTEMPLFELNWCEEHLYKPFIERKFPIELLDHVVTFLYSKEMMSSSSVIIYLQERIVGWNGDDEAAIKDILSLLKKSLNDGKTSESTNLFNKCTEILSNKETSEFKAAVAFEALARMCEHTNLPLNKFNYILNFWKESILKSNKKIDQHISSSFLTLYWYKQINESKSTCNDEKRRRLLEIIEIFEKMMNSQDNTVIPEIFVHLKCLLEWNECDEAVFSFLNLCVKQLMHLKRTDIFKAACENFIQSMFTNARIRKNEKNVSEKIFPVTVTLLELAKSCDDVAYSLGKYVYDLSKFNVNSVVLFLPVVTELLLFGDIMKRDQRAEYTICQQIDADKQRVISENNPNYRRLAIRCYAVDTVQNILKSDSVLCKDEMNSADVLTALLMDKYRFHFNIRYFAHSYVHLQKLRILQALLIIHNHVNIQKQCLIEFLMDALCSENHQVSVKFLIQWLLIRLLGDNQQCLPIIKAKMESTSKVHSSTIIGFIPILYHIALYQNNEAFWINVLDMMLPWTMGAHFNLRLYAQEGILKLCEAASTRGFANLCEKFKNTAKCITEVLRNTERKIDMIDTYGFTRFDARNHYHLHMIYFIIPKMTNVIYDEYENILAIMKDSTNSNTRDLYDKKLCLPNLNQQSVTVFKQEYNYYTTIIQKKIIPDTVMDDNEKIQKKQGSLIVVASLIDKPPNLGGLSRTCEVFGVKQLVISSMNMTKNHEFQNVSMSSENWVNLVEVKVDKLQLFFLQMKECGYSIVGAEQTSDSIGLDTFKFPEKCLLLLGSEKEGIPPNLLSLIDFCVEIPQFGVVRSLNVHVAASTFIWEYTKQHLVS